MEENNSKEVNLMQLLGQFFNWLAKVGLMVLNSIGYLIRLTFKRIWIVMAVILVCVGIGVYLSRPSARVYSAGAMAMLYGSDAQSVREVSRQLENSLSTNNVTSLATKLSIPDSVAQNIVSFHSYYVIDYMKDGVGDKIDFNDNHSLTDTMDVRMIDRLYFQLQTKNINQVAVVQNAIVNYFNKNSEMIVNLNNIRNQMTDQIRISKIEIQRIDSLAKTMYFKSQDQQLRFADQKLIVGEQQKQLFYNDLLKLQGVITSSEANLAKYKQSVELPAGLVVNPFATNGTLKYTVYAIIIGYFISLVLVLLLESKKIIIDYLRK